MSNFFVRKHASYDCFLCAALYLAPRLQCRRVMQRGDARLRRCARATTHDAASIGQCVSTRWGEGAPSVLQARLGTSCSDLHSSGALEAFGPPCCFPLLPTSV